MGGTFHLNIKKTLAVLPSDNHRMHSPSLSPGRATPGSVQGLTNTRGVPASELQDSMLSHLPRKAGTEWGQGQETSVALMAQLTTTIRSNVRIVYKCSPRASLKIYCYHLPGSILGCRFLAGQASDLSKDTEERTEMKTSPPVSVRAKVPGRRPHEPCTASLW